MYYTYWTYQITTGYVVLAVYAFFLISLLLERSVLSFLSTCKVTNACVSIMMSVTLCQGLTSKLNQDLRLHTSSARPNLHVMDTEKLQLSV